MGPLTIYIKASGLSAIIEVYYGLETKKLPLVPCLYFTLVFQVFAVFHIDLWSFAKLDVAWLYPTGITLRVYQVMGSIWSFYCWGVFQSCLQLKLVRRLTQVFTDLKLKSITGRMPSFIFDSPLDEYARTMRLRRNGFTKLQFEAVQDKLESDLQIFIDEIKEDRTRGTIDIIYSQKSLSKMYEMPAIDFFSKRKF